VSVSTSLSPSDRSTSSTAVISDAVVTVQPVDTPIGIMLAGAVDAGVCLLEFTEPDRLAPQMAALASRFPAGTTQGNHSHLRALRDELEAYFAGELTRFDVPLVYPGSDFQVRVWDELLRISYGETRSYEEIAVALGTREDARAVGTANGRNRIAIVIPCHRVVNKSGALGGYGGRLWRKEFLLNLERGQGRLLF
jgi:AraC family transcriptional regulator of adaptative response/methylated-DNA-[protein]-cysteine methyltransferase